MGNRRIERRDTTASPVVTDTLEWDGMGKLRKVTSGGTVVYTATYDGAGERVQSTQSGATHTYSYGAGLLYDSVGSTTYTPGVSHRQAGVDSFYHEDWIGSTRYTTDSTGLVAPSGQRWDAFGNQTAASGSHGGALKWVGGPGYEADGPLGTSLLGARYYDPAVGRFLNADPIGIAGGINQFGYCGEDPVNRVDPLGLSPLYDQLSGAEKGFVDGSASAGTIVGTVLGFIGGGGGGAVSGGGVFSLATAPAGAYLGAAGGAAGGQMVGRAAGYGLVYAGRGLSWIAGSLATLAATKGGGASCPKSSGGGGTGDIHHLSTPKNSKSLARGGPWTPRFEAIFKKAGLSMEDVANKVRVLNHYGPHPELYHRAVYDRLITATNGLSGADYRKALLDELGKLAKEVSTPGTRLNLLITR